MYSYTFVLVIWFYIVMCLDKRDVFLNFFFLILTFIILAAPRGLKDLSSQTRD